MPKERKKGQSTQRQFSVGQTVYRAFITRGSSSIFSNPGFGRRYYRYKTADSSYYGDVDSARIDAEALLTRYRQADWFTAPALGFIVRRFVVTKFDESNVPVMELRGLALDMSVQALRVGQTVYRAHVTEQDGLTFRNPGNGGYYTDLEAARISGQNLVRHHCVSVPWLSSDFGFVVQSFLVTRITDLGEPTMKFTGLAFDMRKRDSH